MASSKDEIYRTALSLPEAERADLIAALLNSLDQGVEEAWRVEIDRRARELETGIAKSIPWDLVKERLSRAQRG